MGVASWATRVVLTAVVLLLVIPAAGGAESSEREISELTEESLLTPEFRSSALSGVAAAAVEETWGEDTEESREASRTAYSDLDGEQASDLVLDAFPEIMGSPTWDSLTLPEGFELVNYLGRDSALIREDGSSTDPDAPPVDSFDGEMQPRQLSDPGAVLVSTMPLRAPEGGQLEPVDPTLVASGENLRPENAAVEASMPTDLKDGIDLRGLGITLAPDNADDAGPRTLVGEDKLFYAGVGPATDFIATSTPAGVETFWQLRSPESPDSSRLELDLPAGAELVADGAGGALVEDSAGPIAIVSAPSAWDADGTPVPVEMTVSGSALELSHPHADGDYRYPILVDPVIEDYNWATTPADCPALNLNGTNQSLPWYWTTTSTVRFGGGCNTSGVTGLLNQQMGNKTGFIAGDYGEWVWRPPTDSYIYQAQFHKTRHTAQATCGIFGVAGSNGWQAHNVHGASLNLTTANPPNYCSSWTADYGWFFNIPTAQATDNNLALMMLYRPAAGSSTLAAQQWSQQAKFYLGDRHAPTVNYTPPATSGIWTNDQQRTDTVSGTDKGLGVSYVWQGLNGTINSYARPCSGIRGANPCTAPTSWTEPA